MTCHSVRLIKADAAQALRRTNQRAWLVVFMILTSLAGDCVAHAAASFQLQRITPREMPLVPGASTRYVLRISNVGDETGIAPLFAYFWFENRWDPYTLTQSGDPRCGPLHPSGLDWFTQGPGFETAPIEPGGTLDCDLRISRPATSPRDTSLFWVVRDTTPPYASTSDVALIGTLAETSITTRNVDFSLDNNGIARATVQLSVHNGGRATLIEQSAGACEDTETRPFFTDGSGPDGCGGDWFGPRCLDWGYGFLIPQLEPGQTHRCLIHLQSFTRYTGPLQFPIDVNWPQQGIGGGTLMDTNRDNNSTVLLLAPTASGEELFGVPSLGPMALGILSAMLALAAMSTRRSRR